MPMQMPIMVIKLIVQVRKYKKSARNKEEFHPSASPNEVGKAEVRRISPVLRFQEFLYHFFCLFTGVIEVIVQDYFTKMMFERDLVGGFIYPGLQTFFGFGTS